MQKNRVGLPEEPAHDGPRRLHPRRRHAALPRARRRSTTSTCGPASRTGCCTTWCCSSSGDGFTALGVMNRLSGSAEEILEVSGQDTKRAGRQPRRGHRPQGPADRAAPRRLGAGRPAARHRAGRARLPRRRARGEGAQRPGRAARPMSCASGWSACGAGAARLIRSDRMPCRGAAGAAQRSASAAYTGQSPKRTYGRDAVGQRHVVDLRGARGRCRASRRPARRCGP